MRTYHVSASLHQLGFLVSLLGGAPLQRCLHRGHLSHIYSFFLSVISVFLTPRTGVESRTSHTLVKNSTHSALSSALFSLFKTGSHKVNLASLKFTLYIAQASLDFMLPSSCQPVLLLPKYVFPLSNKLLLWSAVLSLASVAIDTLLILAQGPASYRSSLHTEGVLEISPDSCHPATVSLSLQSPRAWPGLICLLPSVPRAVTLHNFLQHVRQSPREESYEAESCLLIKKNVGA